MNRIQYLLLIFLLFSNCENNIEDRIPAFQAYVNGIQFWEASSFAITTDASGTIISGNNLSGSILMHIPSLEVGTNDFGSLEISNAVYQDTTYYSTSFNGIGSIAYLSDGEINIEEFAEKASIIGYDALSGKDGVAKDSLIYASSIIYSNIKFRNPAI